MFTIQQEIDQPDFYTYEARFVADDAAADGMAQNNVASAFTHVRGKGQVLLIENIETTRRVRLPRRAAAQRRTSKSRSSAATSCSTRWPSCSATTRWSWPTCRAAAVDDVDNVASFSDEQIEMLVRNTRELGCGLVMIGGPTASAPAAGPTPKLEEAMPVDFQIKSAKVVPVGALCLMMHAGEMPQANYWQKGIAVEAIKTLGAARLLRPGPVERHRPMALGPVARAA